MDRPLFSHEDYFIAWICALRVELNLAKRMLDSEHRPLWQPPTDENTYLLGSIGQNRVVIACFDSTDYNISIAVSRLKQTFPCLQFGLSVGIASGIIGGDGDIGLGDVVVSEESDVSSGVRLYSYGYRNMDLNQVRSPVRPHPKLLSAIEKFKRFDVPETKEIKRSMDSIWKENLLVDNWELDEDLLIEASNYYKRRRDRTIREMPAPSIHYGLIRSGTHRRYTILDDGILSSEGILCFDEEAAGLRDTMPMILIRGISHYHDTDRSRLWRGRAALASAAYARRLLFFIPELDREVAQDQVHRFTPRVERFLQHLLINNTFVNQVAKSPRPEIRDIILSQWLFQNNEFKIWLRADVASCRILWLYGDRWNRDSYLPAGLHETLVAGDDFISGRKILAYYSCVHQDCTAPMILRGLLYQIVKQVPSLINSSNSLSTREEAHFSDIDELSSMFIDLDAALKNKNTKIYCIVDGLSECKLTQQIGFIQKVKDSLASRRSGSQVSFLIATDMTQETVHLMKGLSQINLSSFLETSTKLPSTPVRGFSPDQKQSHNRSSIRFGASNNDFNMELQFRQKLPLGKDESGFVLGGSSSEYEISCEEHILPDETVIPQLQSHPDIAGIEFELRDLNAVIQPPTDSGYASLQHQSAGAKFRTASSRNIEIDDADSGHDSLGRGICAKSIASKEHSASIYEDDDKVSNDQANAEAETDNAYEDSENYDNRSIYTDGSNIPLHKQQAYIDAVADGIYSEINGDKINNEAIERVYGYLPNLLKTFALKLGALHSARIYSDIMVFVRKHRSDISRTLKAKYMKEDNFDLVPSSDAGSSINYDLDMNLDDEMNLDDKMDLWGQTTDLADINMESLDEEFKHPENNDGHGIEVDGEDIDMEDRDTYLPELKIYHDTITGTPAYQWLLKRLHREFNCLFADPDMLAEIREEIMSYLPSPQIVSRKNRPDNVRVKYVLKWDLLAFIKDQQYDTSIDGFLARIIVLAGTSTNAQATTCEQYVNYIWPTFGLSILRLVESTIRATPGTVHEDILSDNTKFKVWVESTDFYVEVVGIRDSVAEVGEQLAWLGCALSSSPYDSQVYYCSPRIDDVHVHNTGKSKQGAPRVCVSFVVDFECDWRYQGHDTPSSGKCWHTLFENPTVVTGYPIACRIKEGTGLEIPLNIMAEMIQTRHVDIFEGQILLKGFSKILVPTKYDEENKFIFWHLLYKRNGDRISYLDVCIPTARNLDFDSLETCRHVLGWCSEASCYAGNIEATYTVERSRSLNTSPDCLLGKKSISQRRAIVDGETVVYGAKDTSPGISHDTYVDKLRWLQKKYVVLWDVGEKRGWLLNGVSTLLHLTYASLEYDRTDSAMSQMTLQLSEIIGPDILYTATSAMQVLLNPNNLILQLYRSSQGQNSNLIVSRAQLKDRIEHIFSMLEKIIDYQEDMAGSREIEQTQDGSNERNRQTLHNLPRKILEGWDFKDIATFVDPIRPRLCKLGTRAKSWVDFIRSISAAALFGKGFGNIIRPMTGSSILCTYWAEVPTGLSYLAVCGSDLANISDLHGDPESVPLRLTRDLILYTPDQSPTICQCLSIETRDKHSEFARIILPSKTVRKHLRKQCSKYERHPNGAIILGYNSDLCWVWKDFGLPEQGRSISSSEYSSSDADDTDFFDSGIGLSNESSTSAHDQEVNNLSYPDYEVGIVCALSKELLAVRALFDEEHASLAPIEKDPNNYCLGSMGGFNVVAAGLPVNDYGNNSAANVASHMTRTFPKIKFCLLVGIGGGVPCPDKDIRLGDIVVGTGVIQYDMGKHIQNGKFTMTGQKQRPSPFLGSVVTKIQSEPSAQWTLISAEVRTDMDKIASMNEQYAHPGVNKDRLYPSHVVHKRDEPTCAKCTSSHKRRVKRVSIHPQVFYGQIASGNQVMKDARLRDRLAKDNDILCFEMEAAGIARSIDCLIIRGICDYADSHKNKEWQEYASAAAAAYAKFFLYQCRN